MKFKNMLFIALCLAFIYFLYNSYLTASACEKRISELKEKCLNLYVNKCDPFNYALYLTYFKNNSNISGGD